MTFVRTLAAAALTCLVAGAAFAEGSADPQSNPHLDIATTWTDAQASMVYGSGYQPVLAPISPVSNDIDAINAAR